MALSEDICWKILRRAHGESVSASWFKGNHTNEPTLEHSAPLFVLERELVLTYRKPEIEDAIYFLEKRGYLIRHGYPGLTRVVYQVSPHGIDVLDAGAFSKEEQEAFREGLIDARRPEAWGVKFNLAEGWRRLRKWLGLAKPSAKTNLPRIKDK